VVLITHDAEVAAHADRIFVMHDGELRVQEAIA
jgi:putative ABC transport system ATP-binding protein